MVSLINVGLSGALTYVLQVTSLTSSVKPSPSPLTINEDQINEILENNQIKKWMHKCAFWAYVDTFYQEKCHLFSASLLLVHQRTKNFVCKFSFESRLYMLAYLTPGTADKVDEVGEGASDLCLT